MGAITVPNSSISFGDLPHLPSAAHGQGRLFGSGRRRHRRFFHWRFLRAAVETLGDEASLAFSYFGVRVWPQWWPHSSGVDILKRGRYL